jgi:GT2 family glycosyltransferase
VSRLAIVIPSVGSVEDLERTLLAVLENRPSRTEIVVVHAHDYQDPYQLQGEVRLLKAPARSCFAACANLGIRETSADVVHLLAAGCQVREGWTEGALRHFRDPRVAVVAPLLIDLAEPTHAVATSVSYGVGGVKRTANAFVADVYDTGVSPILAASLKAVFYNRHTLSSAGYLSTEVGADLADVDLGLLLKHAGYLSIFDPKLQVRTTSGPLEQRNALSRALAAERLFWRNTPAVGWVRSLVAHPLAVAADLASDFLKPAMAAKMCGRMLGLCLAFSARRHHQRLQDLQDAAPVLAKPEGDRQVRIDAPHLRNVTRTPNEEVRTQ